MMSVDQENWIIRLGIILFWWLFWLFNVIDKVVGTTTFLWVGKDRVSQFVNYFSSVGIENTIVPYGFLIFVSLCELAALVFLSVALWHFLMHNGKKAHQATFLGILASLFVFSFFAIGDQIFGDRVELLEHSIYWIAFVLSWYIYTHSERRISDIMPVVE